MIGCINLTIQNISKNKIKNKLKLLIYIYIYKINK